MKGAMASSTIVDSAVAGGIISIMIVVGGIDD